MQSGIFPGNLISQSVEFLTDETCHDTPIPLLICCCRVKMYTERFIYVAARVQSTRSLLASPPCSVVSVTTLMFTLHSTYHYISHPVTLTTTTTSCLSGNLTYGPAHLAQIGGGGVPQKFLSFNMTHLAVVETDIHTTNPDKQLIFKHCSR